MATNSFAAGAYASMQGITSGSVQKAASVAKPPSATSFGSMVLGAVGGVAASGQNAESQAMSALSGKSNVVDVVTAVAEAEASLETFVALQQKLIASYEEVMRLQV
jgi:flagellar hook-basal body complex protein FliE